MPVRFGISLVLEPSFTARVYRARQVICGQYGCWAAEMHMLHVPLLDYFECPDHAVEALDAALANAADGARQALSGLFLTRSGVVTLPERQGDIYLGFTSDGASSSVNALYLNLQSWLGQVPGVVLDRNVSDREYLPRIALMQHASLPSSVFSDATEFAKEVVNSSEMPSMARAWRLLLIRFQSQAAGDDWSDGSWAADLSWQVLSSHEL